MTPDGSQDQMPTPRAFFFFFFFNGGDKAYVECRCLRPCIRYQDFDTTEFYFCSAWTFFAFVLVYLHGDNVSLH